MKRLKVRLIDPDTRETINHDIHLISFDIINDGTLRAYLVNAAYFDDNIDDKELEIQVIEEL
jgi:hypothetical protein